MAPVSMAVGPLALTAVAFMSDPYFNATVRSSMYMALHTMRTIRECSCWHSWPPRGHPQTYRSLEPGPPISSLSFCRRSISEMIIKEVYIAFVHLLLLKACRSLTLSALWMPPVDSYLLLRLLQASHPLSRSTPFQYCTARCSCTFSPNCTLPACVPNFPIHCLGKA